MRLLVVEDDPLIGRAVVNGLREGGYAVDWVRDGSAAELALSTAVYDLVVLDLGLPRKDGLELLRGLCRGGNDVPVLIVTARDGLSDRVTGLDLGADDYLVKPFDLDELLARSRAIVRRRVVFRGQSVDLSAREFAVLEALMREPGAVVSREKLEEAVYGWGEEVGSNTVEVHLHHLRRKLEPQVIRNVRGVGYRIAQVE
jgi:DNA-binding response OmpR family regulator